MTQLFREGTLCTFAEYLSRFGVSNVQNGALQGRCRTVASRFNRSGVPKGVDAPDLGIPNHRFQTVPFRFKNQSIYERKIRFFA